MRTLFFLSLIIISCYSFAQESSYYQTDEYTENEKDESTLNHLSFKERSFIGFNFSVNPFGPDYHIDVSPLFTYYSNLDLILGGGPVYIYSDQDYTSKNTGGQFRKAESKFGLRVFGNYRLYGNLFLRAELEGIYGSRLVENGTFDRTVVPSAYIGISGRTKFSKGKGFAASVLVNTLYNSEQSPVPSSLLTRFEFIF